ncbi:MAG: anhydro-N-acetylmuramic acid kinase [Rubrivivax sp.]|jgi:anhydro-N-acetylmuramic acid kinase|nr:anhydro-N-acetylmuramic acid kinase [Rubrivivax sp.]
MTRPGERPLRPRPLFAGLMSGTSMDGVDAVVVAFDGDSPPQVLAHVQLAIPATLGTELRALNVPGDNELHRAALAANGVARWYAQALAAVLDRAGCMASEVAAVGAHGQTVRHRPGEFDATGYTTQLLNAALLAELSGIDVVADLRSRDVAAGGQGAPLVPAFHARCFRQPERAVAVLNLGGIANLTLLPPLGDGTTPVRGFDCGPANVLSDLWHRRHHPKGPGFDRDGAWAASGRVDAVWLTELLKEPFFALAPPKSTGRDLFNDNWVDRRLMNAPAVPRDVAATLLELTATTAMQALVRELPEAQELLVCGGGAFNAHLMRRLQTLAGPDIKVSSTAPAGMPPDQVEAVAFAWLALSFTRRQPGNLPAVTGAAGPRVLGALYPAA